jgi:hypothetical protein
MDSFAIHKIDVVAGFGILILGMFAFLFKQKDRNLYGVVEIAVAWFTGTTVSMKLTTNHRDLSAWAAVAGATYIVSRGFENAYAETEKSKARDAKRKEQFEKTRGANSYHMPKRDKANTQ